MSQERINSDDQKVKKQSVEIPDQVKERVEKGKTKVRVVHGVNEGYYNLEGKTVSRTRELLKDVYNVPQNAKAFVNGELVEDEFVLNVGETVEFSKEIGEKGTC